MFAFAINGVWSESRFLTREQALDFAMENWASYARRRPKKIQTALIAKFEPEVFLRAELERMAGHQNNRGRSKVAKAIRQLIVDLQGNKKADDYIESKMTAAMIEAFEHCSITFDIEFQEAIITHVFE